MPDRTALMHDLDMSMRHLEKYRQINTTLRSQPRTVDGLKSLQLNEELMQITEKEIRRLRLELGLPGTAESGTAV